MLSTCIASIPAYLMSMIKFPKWAINAITSKMSHFFWDNLGDAHKYHLANWGLVSRKKFFGSTGIPDLRDLTLPCWLPKVKGILTIDLMTGKIC